MGNPRIKLPNKRVIIFNGPPGVGKDFAANVLVGRIECTDHFIFKSSLYELTAKLFLVPLEEVIEHCTDRNLKEKPTPIFHGKTPREALIFVSEVVVKPNFGEDYFGRAEAQYLLETYKEDHTELRNIVYSDGGFKPEIMQIANLVGPENVKVVQLLSPDMTFKGDSRGFIEIFPKDRIQTEAIINRFDESFRYDVLDSARNFLYYATPEWD